MRTIATTLKTLVAIEIALKTIFIMDIIKLTVQAHLFPFSSPYALMKYTIPIAVATPPATTNILPKVESEISVGGMPELVKFPLMVRFPTLKLEDGSEEINVPAATAKTPKTSAIIPTMMLRIAIIVTPVGRNFGVLCKC